MRKLLVPILGVSAALALAGCGGGSSNAGASGTTTTTTTAGGRGFQNAAFTACLKSHGITLPAGGFGGRRGGSGGFGGRGARGGSGPAGGSGRRGGRFFGGGGFSIPGVSAQKMQAALSACRSTLPNGGRFGGSGFAGGPNASQLRAYLTCLGNNGVTVPTTTTAAGGNGFGGGFGVLRAVRNDPHFAAASKKCQALAPTRGGPPVASPAG